MINKQILFLFDVDGTLTESRKKILPEVLNLLKEIKTIDFCKIGFVGGSDLDKQKEQIGEDVLSIFDYSFPENGLVYYKKEKLIFNDSVLDFIGLENYNLFVNFVLDYLSKLDIPVKTGTYIELRTGLINISPIGRDCDRKQREEFEKYDLVHKVREKMIYNLKENFLNLNLKYSIGGQISFDVFPIGWDKTYCLSHLEEEGFDKIYFFGDKTFEGGNDFEIFSDERVIGYSVKSHLETISILNDLLKSYK